MKRLMLITAALTFSASIASAAITANDLIAAFQAQGYSKIEVTTGLTQIKVEAVKGNAKVDVIYDAATGAILQQEAKWAKRSERSAGLAQSTSANDFLNAAGTDVGTEDSAATETASEDTGSELNDDTGSDASASGIGAETEAADDQGGDDDGASGGGQSGRGSRG